MQFWINVVLMLLTVAQSRPAGWQVRSDRPGLLASEPYFVSVNSGWHITTGPSVLAYQPTSTAKGTYRLESEILLFPGERNEGYGLFVGGNALDSNNLSYTAFQLRQDGRFSIWSRTGTTTKDIVPWTPHPAIAAHKGGVDPVKNLIVIEVETDSVTLRVNGRPVNVGRRSLIGVEGNFGFRVNENLNIQATKLALQ